MSRKVSRVPVNLDAKGIKNLPDDEIRIILRGADDLIMRGGRSQLAKILKGSKEKRILELELDKSPVHGALKQYSLADITARVDWLLLNKYLDIEYDYRLPLLVFAPLGWEIEKVTLSTEYFDRLNAQIAATDTPPDLSQYNDYNREVVMLLLDTIEHSKDPIYIPVLEQWSENTYKKIKYRILEVIQNIQCTDD